MTTAFTPDAAGSLTGPAWLVDRRRAAAERFAAAELPTTDEEVWRYSRIGDLDLGSRLPPASAAVTREPGDRARSLAAALVDSAITVITVDGHVVEQSGAVGSISVGVADTAEASALGVALDGAFDAGPDPLRDLHDAFCQPVEIAVDADAEVGPIVVIHEATDNEGVSFPRLIVRTGQNARATVVEVFVSADGVRTLAFPVTELVVDRDASVSYACVQVLGDQSWQLARLASSVGQNATVRAGTIAYGGDYSRLRCDTTLAGRGANGELYAGYMGTGSQLLDFRTFQDHQAADTTSNLLFKGALADKSASVYTGLIKIRPEGRGSQAFQTNHNLKLSSDTFAESVPNLEIENNEVQCSHASTVGPVDAEQRFYLESRGVPTERAERLIVKGIFDEVFAALPLGGLDPFVRERLDEQLDATEFEAVESGSAP